MPWSTRVMMVTAVCAFSLPAARGKEPSARTSPRVELRWVECKWIEGLTVDVGFQSTCAADSIVYPHNKPALVLTPEDVSTVRLSETAINASNGRFSFYMVVLRLTPDARGKLAESLEGNQTRQLTVVVDGKYWGVHCFRKGKDKPAASKSAGAKSFPIWVGFFSSRAEAERLRAALE